jgi:SAM-dependent methyltransferase
MDLSKIERLIAVSNAEHRHIGASLLRGFVPSSPREIVAVVKALHKIAPGKTFLDLGCGTGGWMLIAAGAGFPSYGVESNPLMLKACRKNLADARELLAAECVVAEGNMISKQYWQEYANFILAHPDAKMVMPVAGKDPYATLPVSIHTADIICTWSWPLQSKILFDILDREAKQEAIFVLPSYERYISEHPTTPLRLRKIARIGKTFIGVR